MCWDVASVGWRYVWIYFLAIMGINDCIKYRTYSQQSTDTLSAKYLGGLTFWLSRIWSWCELWIFWEICCLIFDEGYKGCLAFHKQLSQDRYWLWIGSLRRNIRYWSILWGKSCTQYCLKGMKKPLLTLNFHKVRVICLSLFLFLGKWTFSHINWLETKTRRITTQLLLIGAKLFSSM